MSKVVKLKPVAPKLEEPDQGAEYVEALYHVRKQLRALEEQERELATKVQELLQSGWVSRGRYRAALQRTVRRYVSWKKEYIADMGEKAAQEVMERAEQRETFRVETWDVETGGRY